MCCGSCFCGGPDCIRYKGVEYHVLRHFFVELIVFMNCVDNSCECIMYDGISHYITSVQSLWNMLSIDLLNTAPNEVNVISTLI